MILNLNPPKGDLSLKAFWIILAFDQNNSKIINNNYYIDNDTLKLFL